MRVFQVVQMRQTIKNPAFPRKSGKIPIFFLLIILLFTGVIGANSAESLRYSTLIGDTQVDVGSRLAVANDGTAYVVGTTFSSQFPQERNAEHGLDAVIFGISADGSALRSVIWINPPNLNDEDHGYDIVLDKEGNQLVVGVTRSADFCAVLGNLPGEDKSYNGNSDGFLLRINALGSADYCSFIGGSESDTLQAVAIAEDGSIYAVGSSWSADLPHTTTQPQLRDIFVAQFTSTLTWSKTLLLGGAGQEEALALAADSQFLYLTGWTFSADFPSARNQHHGGADAFLLRLQREPLQVDQMLYWGDTGEDRGYDLALTSHGVAIAGMTQSDGDSDGFITLISDDQQQNSVQVGGSGKDRIQGIAVMNDRIFVTGTTDSADFPTTPDALDTQLDGGQDAFLVAFDLATLTPHYSTLWGGSDWERGGDVAIQGNDIYWLGETRSADFTTTANSYDTTINGDYDIFLTKLSITLDFGRNHTLYLPIISK